MSDFDFSDINLDFLQSTPPKKPSAHTVSSPLVKADLNLVHRTNNDIRAKKRLEWAKKVASVDELLKEIQKLKCDKLQLQTQLRDFQKSALDIQSLYTTEKRGHELKTKALQDLQQKFDQVDTDLVVKSLKCDQLESSLADQKDRPVDYNELVVKYLKIIHKLDGEDGLKGFLDRSLVEDLKQYCTNYKLKLPVSPKKPKSRTTKIRREDIAVQCEILQESPPPIAKPETKCQGIQCQVELRTQGTQHISTMTTRSTTTSCFISFRNVGTNFPETQTPSQPAVNDILKEFAPWQNITPISPLTDIPQISEEVRKTFKTIGTCTWLCNIRRSIDFIPRTKLKRTQSSRTTSCEMVATQGIKEEVTTPAHSPTPTSQPNVPTSQSINTSATQITGAIVSNQNMTANPLLASMNSTLQLSQGPNPSFHELWHIFGRMVLGLLQTTNSSSAGIAANSTMNQEAVNQQQFHNWLRELYDSSVAAATTIPTAVNEQTSSAVTTNEESNNVCSQTDYPQEAPYTHSVGTSPLHFNTSSPLSSTNIARPQARRNFEGHILNSQETEVALAESDEEDISPDLLNAQNTSIGPPLSRPHKKKHKHKMFDEIQELFPISTKSKDKQKALKRLLKSKKTKKKSVKTKDSTTMPPPLVTNEESVVLMDVPEENENGAYVETAIDFLKGIFEKDANGHEVQEKEKYSMDDDTLVSQYENPAPNTKATLTDTENVNSCIRESNNPAIHDQQVNKGEASVQNSDVGESLIHNNSHKFPHHTILQGQMSDHTYSTNTERIPAQMPTSSAFKETFSFTKPAEKSKKAKYSNKKELYSTLFGDSDTELDENDADDNNSIRNSLKFASEYNDSANSKAIRSNCYRSNSDLSLPTSVNSFGTSKSPVSTPFESSQNSHTEHEDITIINDISLNSEAIKSNFCPTQNSHMFAIDTSCLPQNQDLAKDSTLPVFMPICDIPTPILRNIETSLMNTTQPFMFFDGMDQETHHRLDSIINEQLENIPLGAEQTIMASGDFPSDFEKDFELSSEEEGADTNTTELLNVVGLSTGCESDDTHKSWTATNEVRTTSFELTKEDVNNETLATRGIDLDGMDVNKLNIQSCSQNRTNYALKDKHQSNSSMHQLFSEKECDENQKSSIGEVELPTNAFAITENLIAGETFSSLPSISNDGAKHIESNNESSDMDVEDVNRRCQSSSQINKCHSIKSYDAALEKSIHQSNFSLDLEKTHHHQNRSPKISSLNEKELSQRQPSVGRTSRVSDTSQVEENVSVTSTEGECSIIEISSDYTDMEKTTDVTSSKSELIIDEDLVGSNNKEPGEPVKLKIKEEIGYNKMSNSSQDAGGALNQLNTHLFAKQCTVPIDIALQMESPISATNNIKEMSIFEMSSGDIADMEQSRDVSDPNDELMIDEDGSGDEESHDTGKLNILKEEIYHPTCSNGNKDFQEHNQNDKQNISSAMMKSSHFNNTGVFNHLTAPLVPAAVSFVTVVPRQVENAVPITSIEDKCSSNGVTETKKTNIELMIDEDAGDNYKESNKPVKQRTSSKMSSQYMTENMPTNSQKTEGTDTSAPTTPVQNADYSINSSPISSILDSTLYKEILNDSMCPIVDDILRDADDILLKSPMAEKKITRSGRKRKSECQPEAQPPCKRSERIKAKNNNLGHFSNVSLTPVEIGKYTRVNKNNIKVTSASLNKKLRVSDQLKTKEIAQENLNNIQIGFFREIDDKVRSDDNGRDMCTISNRENEEHHGLETETNQSANNSKCTYNIEKPTTSKEASFCSKQPLIPADGLEIVTESLDAATFPQTTDTAATCNYSPVLLNTTIETSNTETFNVDISTTSSNNNLFSSTFDYSESPQSPQYENTVEYLLNTATLDIPLDLSPEYKPKAKVNSLLESLISNYSKEHHNVVVVKNSVDDNPTKRQRHILSQYHGVLSEYCCNPMNLDPDLMAAKVVGKLQQYSIDNNLLCLSIMKIVKEVEASSTKESELPSIIQEMPPRHFNLSMQRLFYLLKHLSYIIHEFCAELQLKIESHIFNFQQLDRISLHGCVHLTQLYLIACKLQEQQLQEHPARIFIVKCLYFYTIKAIPMIHEVLMWYPTTMPHREESAYDRSDPLITVIQHCLMCYKYDMDKPELRGKSLISKLRYEYHYEAFKPTMDEVAKNLVEKLKSSKFNNITIAFSLFCKRLYPIKAEPAILQAYLLPLANKYYNEALHDNNDSHDIRISNLLTIISIIIKPFPLDWNIEVYLNLFSRYLSAINRSHVQEAAACAILRLQRFGYVNCFNRLRSFKPTYELSSLTQAMFKTFIHRKKEQYLKTIKKQNPINLQ